MTVIIKGKLQLNSCQQLR